VTEPPVNDGPGGDPLLGDPSSLDDWIGDRRPGRGQPLRVARLGEGSGIANALFVLRRGAAK
jgi:hypothetical protein